MLHRVFFFIIFYVRLCCVLFIRPIFLKRATLIFMSFLRELWMRTSSWWWERGNIPSIMYLCHGWFQSSVRSKLISHAILLFAVFGPGHLQFFSSSLMLEVISFSLSLSRMVLSSAPIFLRNTSVGVKPCR